MSRNSPRRKGRQAGPGAAAPDRVVLRRPSDDADCPCGTEKTYGDCCGALHTGRAKAATAEQLMRSRYSAFAVGDVDYLLRSWHSSTRPAELTLDPGLSWTGLRILGTTDGTAFHHEGAVVFEASYADHGEAGSLTEDSEFRRENGDWVYVAARGDQ